MIIWIIAALCAFFVKGLCGFANTLVFDSILTFGNNNINVTPVELLLGFPTNLIIAFKERKSIRAKIWIPLALLVITGSIPGIFLLKEADTTVIKIVFGVVVILIGIEMLVRDYAGRTSAGSRKNSVASKALLFVIGVLSGVLCGLYGIGALLGAYIGRVSDNTREFKANICTVFIVENTFRIILYTATGILSFEVLKKALLLVPFMLVGLFLGMKLSGVLDEKLIKKLVVVMLIVSGIVLVISNVSFE